MYELTTNEGRMFIRCKPSFKEQMAYVRDKLDRGYKLSEIMYCYGPIRISEHGPGFNMIKKGSDGQER